MHTEGKGYEIPIDDLLRIDGLMKGVTVLESDEEKAKCKCNECGEGVLDWRDVEQFLR